MVSSGEGAPKGFLDGFPQAIAMTSVSVLCGLDRKFPLRHLWGTRKIWMQAKQLKQAETASLYF